MLAVVVLAAGSTADARTFRYNSDGTVSPSESKALAGEKPVIIYGSADDEIFRPVIKAFQRSNPKHAVIYHDISTLEIYERVIREAGAGGAGADVLLSSAVDLQLKLVNDGYAMEHRSAETARLPEWAVWRDEAFGFTYEPAVIAYNKSLIPHESVPRTRRDLIRILEQNDRFFGKIATYDPERSGLGFLFLTQDAHESKAIWSLASLFGANGVKLYTNTGTMLDRVADGKSLIAYNVIGSYAEARAKHQKTLGIIYPEDYTLVMSRIAVIPKSAPHPGAARAFLDFLISPVGQQIIANQAGLFSIHSDVTGDFTMTGLKARQGNALKPIRVGPGLLVYLDQAKRQRFLRKWRRALNGRIATH
ncbi:MAG: iron ABC transporter substrate-binding protein [Rhodospirillales bacterium CG15_BIG_FIL_POST_REV_8_21_14_020_66_15]|nr:MAG: iron ABC transporter substrate-binding protein [Rhodospirillales bacterium CG15_BIG_FIL_POST_REV_8_21_14_020_66_15]